MAWHCGTFENVFLAIHACGTTSHCSLFEIELLQAHACSFSFRRFSVWAMVEFNVGDSVEYYSSTAAAWVLTVVKAVDQDKVELELHSNGQVDVSKIRHLSSPAA